LARVAGQVCSARTGITIAFQRRTPFSSASSSPVGTLSGASTAALRLDIDTVKVGINYRFNPMAPVVAKY
jgi:hypothetical protein